MHIYLPSFDKLVARCLFEQQLEALRFHWGDSVTGATVFAGEADIQRYREWIEGRLGNVEILPYARKQETSELSIALLPHPHLWYDEPYQALPSECNGPVTWFIDGLGRRTSGHGETEEERRLRSTHVFQALSTPGVSCAYPFPFTGFLGRNQQVGPVNSFGFRCQEHLQSYRARPSEHKLVAVFGGSSGFSPLCLPHQMFTYQLERRLNDLCESRGSSVRFTVLNFGIPSAVVLTQLAAYLLFAEPLKPEIVIAHDGFNDLTTGSTNDPYLIEYDILYDGYSEEWARLLQRPDSEPASRAPTPPLRVIQAYIARKRQFRRLVEQAGGIFISGLQPAWGSKPALHPVEEFLIQEIGGCYRGVTELNEIVSQYYADEFELNFHALFKTLDRNEMVFGDLVHLLPAGDRILGDHYAQYIIEQHIAEPKDG